MLLHLNKREIEQSELDLLYSAPNITGSFGRLIWQRYVYGAFTIGPTEVTNQNKNSVYDPTGGESFGVVEFYASLSNNLYGASNTVQPLSLRLLPLIKF